MRTVLFVVALLLVLSSGAMAQSKMEALGLRGPVKVVVEVVVKESLVSYSFSKDGKIEVKVSSMVGRDVYMNKYDGLERIYVGGRIENGSEEKDFYTEYDEEKKEYHVWNCDGEEKKKQLFVYGKLDEQGRPETVIIAGSMSDQMKNTYDSRGNLVVRESREGTESKVVSKTEHQYGEKNQLARTRYLRWDDPSKSMQLTDEVVYHYYQDGYLVRVERIRFEAGKEKETKEDRRYEYIFFDSYGNWTKRFCYQDGKELLEERSISYYGEGFDLFQEVLGFAKLRIMNKGAVR